MMYRSFHLPSQVSEGKLFAPLCESRVDGELDGFHKSVRLPGRECSWHGMLNGDRKAQRKGATVHRARRALGCRAYRSHHAETTVGEGGAQLFQAVHGESSASSTMIRLVGSVFSLQVRLAIFKSLVVSRSEGNRTGRDVARVNAALLTPCLVAHWYLLEASARLAAGRSLRCAPRDRTRERHPI